MAVQEDSLPLIRSAFTRCIEDLVEKTDFDVMYNEINNTNVGKERMPYVFVLRADSWDSTQDKSQELYNGINKEKDEHFFRWFNTIKLTLHRTGNQNNGKHQEVWEKMSSILHDSGRTVARTTMCGKVSAFVIEASSRVFVVVFI